MKNVSKNITSGIIRKIISVALPFLIRTAIIYCLGAEYLGLNSLFTSILSVLNLTELGVSNAIVFCMYKPLAEKNIPVVRGLLNFFKKVYVFMGCIIMGLGLVITPFLSMLIKGEVPNDINVYILFWIYLLNTIISYFFFAYKSALLNAAQRIDVYNWIQIVTCLLQYLIQLFVLMFLENYLLYIIVMPVCTVLCNIITCYYTNKIFPEYIGKGKIRLEEKQMIREKLKGMIIYKLSEVSRNSFDSIVLSAFFGLVTVAVYNNYFYVFSALYSIMVAINQGIQAGVGNDIVMKSRVDNFIKMRRINYYVMWVVSWWTVCLLFLMQPFMTIWAGSEMLLSTIDMALFAVYFYVLNMCNVRNLYYDGNGLWLEGKWTFVSESIFNLVLNIVLGKIWGITGVLIATILTIFIFSFCCRTQILFKEYFKCSSREFMIDNLKILFETLIMGIITFIVLNFCDFNDIWIQFVVEIIICIIVPNLVQAFLNKKSLLEKLVELRVK